VKTVSNGAWISILVSTSIGTATSTACFFPGNEREAIKKDVRTSMSTHPYVGMWVTADGVIRHELLPTGRYDEARGSRKSAYQGNYRLTGNHIDYVDDTGFTADGEFVDGVLYHAGMVLFRER